MTRPTPETLAAPIDGQRPVRVPRISRSWDNSATQVQLAQLVGASRERANKALSDFASRGWLRLERRSVVLTDLPQLSQWAQATANP